MIKAANNLHMLKGLDGNRKRDAPGPSRINFSEVQFNCNIETFFGDDVKLS